MADSDCYINQHDDTWKDLALDVAGEYTVDHYGCIVCCAAMCICHRLGISDKAGKKKVIQAIINDRNCVTEDGDFMYTAFITYKGEYFCWTRDDKVPDMYGWPIVYYKKWNPVWEYWAYHAVLYTDPWTVLDPAVKDNTSPSNCISWYGPTIHCYWPH